MARLPPDVFIHADGTVETRSRVELPGTSHRFHEPARRGPMNWVAAIEPPSDTGQLDYWVRTWELMRTAPGDGQAATHGVRIFVERP